MKGNKIDLVLCDVDGTLFDRKDTMTDDILRLAEIVQQHKIPFTLASGRCYEELEKIVECVGVKLPMIVNNGTGILTKEKVYWTTPMNTSILTEAVKYADACGMLVSFYDEMNRKVIRWNPYVQTWIDRFDKHYTFCFGPDERIQEDFWNNLKIQKMLIIDPQKPGRIDEVIGRIPDRENELSIIKYDDRSADFMPKGCDKSNAMIKLAQILSIPMENIMAIGDNENDIQMLRLAGIGVAVNNATDDLKQHADYVCHLDSAAGVAEAIEAFYINNKKG